MKRIFFTALIPMFSTAVFAAADTGKIVEVYTHPGGAMALRLDGGIPNANSEVTCYAPDIRWAGVDATADRSLKAAMLAAKIAGSDVTIVTLGHCVGNWIKIEAMQIK